MPIEIEVEVSVPSPEISVDVENTEPDIEVDVIKSGEFTGNSFVKNQLGATKAQLAPGETYVVTEFNTLRQKILGPVPLTVTQNILD